MTTPAYDAMWDVHLEAIRFHAHQLVAWAYADVRPRLGEATSEPEMTGLLASAMRYRLSHHPDTPESYLVYWVNDQDPTSPRGELGNERLRLDITVVLNGVRPRGVFVFEAKRLRTGGFPIGLYAGSDGMGCFLDGRYAQECPEAAMVALWQNRELHYWLGELHRVLEEDKKRASPLFGMITELLPAIIIPHLPDEWETSHRRSSGGRLRLFHIFLECR